VIKILVVDDSALVRKLIGQVFSTQSDFEVRFARNGREALDTIRVARPDVVTLDVHMPEMDGLTCLDRIMIEQPCPVIMVSSMTAEGADATLEALRLGAVDFVAKPTRAVSLRICTGRSSIAWTFSPSPPRVAAKCFGGRSRVPSASARSLAATSE